MAAAEPLIVFYDEDCGWCRWSIARVIAFDRDHTLQLEPIQGLLGDELLGDIPLAQRMEAAHAVSASGARGSGGDAAAMIAECLPALKWSAPLLRLVPGPTRAGYRLVADNRTRLGRFVSPAMRERADAAIARHRAATPA